MTLTSEYPPLPQELSDQLAHMIAQAQSALDEMITSHDDESDIEAARIALQLANLAQTLMIQRDNAVTELKKARQKIARLRAEMQLP